MYHPRPENQEHPPGVPHCSEMGPGVVVEVDHLDGHLPQAHTLPGGLDEHIHLIFEPLPADGQAPLQHIPGHAPQPGLGVRQADAVEQVERPAGDPVAHLGPDRHVLQAQVPDPHDQLVRLLRRGPRHGAHILHGMLAVGVGGGHRPPLPRRLAGDIGRGGLQRPASALVLLVAQHGAAVHSLQGGKDVLPVRPAPVVHHHHLEHTLIQQLPDVAGQTGLRVQRRDRHNGPGELAPPLFC